MMIRSFMIFLCAAAMACQGSPESVVALSHTKTESAHQPRNTPRKPPTMPTSSYGAPIPKQVNSHRSCLRSKGGCPQGNTQLQLCDESQKATKLSEASPDIKGWIEAHKTVALEGKLTHDAVCQTKTCPPANPCCNDCLGPIKLTDGVHSVSLVGDKPSHYTCKGDASLICCGIDVRRQKVVITGVLQDGPDGGHTLKVQSICER